MIDISIIGTGGLAKEIIDHIEHINNVEERFTIVNFFVEPAYYKQDSFMGLPVYKLEKEGEKNLSKNIVCAVGDGKRRLEMSIELEKKGFHFPQVVHPSAIVGKKVTIHEGVIIGPYVSITGDAIIGKHVIIVGFCGIGHDTSIGDGSILATHIGIGGGCKIGRGTSWGNNSSILPDKTVGDFARIGAGSVCLRNIKENKSVFGNPAQEMN
ncbi:MAG: hypothetical protein HQK84_08200 [Nitrospinae bacterium]|nr:hypothetical protein [Nitrospinota bacterium]